MSSREFGPGSAPLRGTVSVPGDKSISHRAILFASMAEGTTELTGVLDSGDVRVTISAVESLGATVSLRGTSDGSLRGEVTGWGSAGPVPRESTIDCGNSGTTARLLLGLLAGWPVEVTLTGDESLSRRPMLRVTAPLEEMGARFDASGGGTLPIKVNGSAAPSRLEFSSPVASAQVKTSVLLAGLRASGRTSVTEPAPSRDHTERLLPLFGASVESDPVTRTVSVCGPRNLIAAAELAVPRDPSSAAFLVAASLLVPGSSIRLPGVSANPTRAGFLRVLERMGGSVRVHEGPMAGEEPVADVSARFSVSLSATVVSHDEVPSLIDEVPILALVASQAAGESRFEGVAELRVKESDRFAALVEGLHALGADVHAEADTLVVRGPTALRGATIDSLGDHRLAMTWAVAGLLSSAPVLIDHFDAVDVSYPAFADDLARLQNRRQ